MADSLRDELEIATAGIVEWAVVSVTGGEYAQLEPCNGLYVWVQQIVDRQEIAAVDIRIETMVTFGYKMAVCFQEFDRDQTEAEHVVVAEQVADLMEAVWCAIVHARDDNTLMGLGSCDDVRLTPLSVVERSGAQIVMAGSVEAPYDCEQSSS